METKYIDLHCHSYCSDGTFSPEGLVILAKKQNLSALALTDHDTLDGLPLFHKAGKKYGLETISGIEFGVLDGKQEIHIVGLDFDCEKKELHDAIAWIQQARKERNKKMVKRLCEIGLPITLEEVEKNAGGEIVTRAHYANVMVKRGYVKHKDEAFEKYITEGLPGYVERETLTPDQCIALICRCGGIAVLAHPTQYKLNSTELEQLCIRLQSYGLAGIEAEYSTFTAAQEKEIKKLAQGVGLAFSGGSDFHGANKSDIQLGIGRGNLKIPYTYLETLRKQKL